MGEVISVDELLIMAIAARCQDHSRGPILRFFGIIKDYALYRAILNDQPVNPGFQHEGHLAIFNLLIEQRRHGLNELDSALCAILPGHVEGIIGA